LPPIWSSGGQLCSRSWEEGTKVPGGGDPSSPVDPKLRRKFITTTWVSAILFALLWLTLRFHLVSLPQIPTAA